MSQKSAVWFVAIAIGVVAAVLLLTPAPPVKKNIGNDELVRLQSQGVSVIDVRTPSEFAAAHLPGAVNVPMDQLAVSAQSWDKATPLAIYCATGARSANAVEYLAANGFKKVYNLTEGIVAWSGPTETGGAPGVAALPTTVKTSGKPLFIDFASST